MSGQQQRGPVPFHQLSAQQQQQMRMQPPKRQAPQYWDVLGSNEGFQRAKRATPTDRMLPPLAGSSLASGYASLQAAERKLDWNVGRKKVELKEAIDHGQTVKRTLRVKVWNTVSGQKWQQPARPEVEDEPEEEKEGGIPGLGMANGEAKVKDEAVEGLDFGTGEGVPQWTLHVEGHLLEPALAVPDHAPAIAESPRPFSTLLKALIIRVDRPDGLYPEPNVSEWRSPATAPTVPNPPNQAPPSTYPSFSLTRTGSENVGVAVALHLDQMPERVKVPPALGRFLDLQEESLPGIVQALWAYVKKERLQDSDDKRFVRKDHNLAFVYGGQPNEKIPFHYLEEMTKRFVSPADPLLLAHEIRVDDKCEEGAKFYDVEVEIADPARLQMKQVLEALSDGDATTREIRLLDEKIADGVARIKESSKRRTFFSSFAEDPVTFLSTWLSSQSADLDTLLGRDRGHGAAGAGAGESFKGDWLAEGIALYESRNVMQKAAAGGFRR